jgi:hypothetical protein
MNMKLRKTLAAFAALVSLSFAGTQVATVEELVVQPKQSIVSTEVVTSYATDNIYRGVDTGQNTAQAVVNAAFELPSETTMTVQTGYSKMDSSLTSEEATELGAEFSKTVADYLVSLSYVWNSKGEITPEKQSQEIGLSVQREFGPVTVTLSQYLSLKGDNNGYSEIGALYSDDFDVLPLEIDFAAQIGYLSQDSSFTHFQLKASTDLFSVEGVTASPFIAYNYQLGGEYLDGVDSNSNLFGGILFKRDF